ncbi:17-beta-hydroxysteroid dehydrogenase 13-like isoform X2 [Cataglyphis hispanica]|uniref:17-beta-hydroxysteroid dehydrogenase 13-like isoform X2 n=1 Tax=Cataglyphis hispanica TaxID=1086592 RepID=UPI00217FCEAE|nr:17-beta-hydroxysteroid dehydrogenase 13-like isoform X2 [Cataglyphis hispanica]XP_050452084.1 17-beta-hydroxysteroid dehydrogenase 13-like isoform X2 [Cataglyphis hispanica]XP_050452086.1 17-beta-hydroxysteroid dehydrogenase 13-like isoform X2 [Cataglyphis hispanica]
MKKLYDGMLLLAEILFLILKVLYFFCESIFTIFIPATRKSVAGEVVLVTGAGHGIGKELAIGYASLGATVVCWDINEKTNNQTMNEIKMMGKNTAYAYQCDVTNRKEVFKVAEKVRKEVGDVTILVNNAGTLFVKKLLDQSADEIRRVIDVNLISHYWTLQAFLPSMIEKNHGHVVAISSLTAFVGATHGTVYCPTKSAVKALMEAISNELRTYSKGKSLIKFTTVFPTLVFTGLLKKIRIRFSNIMGGISPQKAASLIIDAQRQNFKERGIPSYWLPILQLKSIAPNKVFWCIFDFLGLGADEEN